MSLQEFQPSGLLALRADSFVLESRALRKNPLGDPWVRRHPVLSPKDAPVTERLPLVVVLAGFGASGEKYLAAKSFERNFAQSLDLALRAGAAPRARYLLVEAMTFWGGSQYVNSAATGNYEDMIVRELLPAFFAVAATDPRRVCVTGGSSGGYGALHLASRYPDLFPYCAAHAPDAAFELSLLPDLLNAAPLVAQYSQRELRELHRTGRLASRKNGFGILNALAMSACYSPRGKGADFDFPIDLRSGEWLPAVRQRWQEKDPVVFLPKRAVPLRRLRKLWLDVGRSDEFHLQFGARRIREALKGRGVRISYSEFDGGHSDLAERRGWVWRNLKAIFA